MFQEKQKFQTMRNQMEQTNEKIKYVESLKFEA